MRAALAPAQIFCSAKQSRHLMPRFLSVSFGPGRRLPKSVPRGVKWDRNPARRDALKPYFPAAKRSTQGGARRPMARGAAAAAALGVIYD